MCLVVAADQRVLLGFAANASELWRGRDIANAVMLICLWMVMI
jgi:hypothetical protein